jgi:hypothetical protein
MALNGLVSALVRDPATRPNKHNRFDGGTLAGDQAGAQFVFRFGRYYFDGNPFIGRMAGVAAWPALLPPEELGPRTSCTAPAPRPGTLLPPTRWTLTTPLVTEQAVEEAELGCGRHSGLVTAHLPVPALDRREAEELCSRLGSDVYMAGEINNKVDFDAYYDGIQANLWYREACGYHDNGRIKTWLPYRVNGSVLQHERTGAPLFGPYFASWYPPPGGLVPGTLGSAYFGLVPRYENILAGSGEERKCTACALHASHARTSTVTLRGLCRYSVLDTEYQVQYSPEQGISYRGVQRTLIRYSRSHGAWRATDLSDPAVSMVSPGPFRSLALGTRQWTVYNDTGCSPGPLPALLSLTSCGPGQFTCWDGLCLPLAQRCDGQPQCRDSSDELACAVLEPDPSYNKFLSPPGPAAGPLPVNLSVTVLTLASFDPIQGNYAAKFRLSLQWLDSRLR